MARINGAELVVTANASAFAARLVAVPTAGTPVQLPSLLIPDGFSCTVRASENNGTKRIYLSDSSANALDATKRIELRKAGSVELQITNTNLIWIDASANTAEVEILVEQ